MSKSLTRRAFLRSFAGGAAALLVACQPKVVEKVVEKTVIVEKPVEKVVKETVIVAGTPQVVEKVVKETVVVEKQVAAPRKKVEIRWHAFSGPYGDWSTKRAEEFSAASEEITVKVEPFPSDGYRAKLRSMFASELIGDAFWHWDVTAWVAEWAHLGMSRPIDDLVEGESFDLGVYYPASIEGATFKGKLMGLPLHAHGTQSIMLHNQDMLDAVNVEYPEPQNQWSLDELVEIARKLTVVEGGKTQRFGWTYMSGWDPMNNWARIFGGELISADGTQALLNSPEVTAAVQFLVDTMYKHEVAPRPEEIETSYWAMFAAEKVAMTQAGSSYPPRVRQTVKDRFGWATVLLPEGPPPKGQRAAVSATHVGSISSLSENPEATWKFLKFMASYESGVDKVLFGAGAPGARPDCYSDPKLLQNAPEYEVVAMAMSVARAEHTPANLRGAEMSTTFNNEMGDIWLNEVGVEEGLEKANQALQEVLDKPLP